MPRLKLDTRILGSNGTQVSEVILFKGSAKFQYLPFQMRQSACLVLNPITVYSYGFLFNCTTVGQASDSMTALT